MMLKFREKIRKIYEFPISANKPRDLTHVRPAPDWNKCNLNEKIS